MSHLNVVYCRSYTIGALLIRASSWWDQWSHCGIVTPKGTVIEARAFAGVVESDLEEFVGRYSELEVVKIDCPDPAAAIEFARMQVGAGYDYGAIAEFVLRNPLNKHQRWHCAELVETALIAGGRDRFRRMPHRVSVAQSYMVK